MSPIGEGIVAFGAILLGAVLPTEIWRWLGTAVGRGINADGEVLQWVRAVATGVIAAFVSHVIFIPAGALAHTPLWLRLTAVAIGVIAYAVGRRLVFVGVGAGALTVIVGLTLAG